MPADAPRYCETPWLTWGRGAWRAGTGYDQWVCKIPGQHYNLSHDRRIKLCISPRAVRGAIYVPPREAREATWAMDLMLSEHGYNWDTPRWWWVEIEVPRG